MLYTEVLHQTTAVLPAILNDLEQGISYGWLSPTILSFKTKAEFSVTTLELSWLGSASEFGKIIGPLLAALFIDKFGRKKILIFCALIFFLSWFSIVFSTSVLFICIARAIFGVAHGANDTTMSIYLGENFSTQLRAIFCSIALVSLYAAELVEFVVASMFSYRVVAGINASIAFVGLLSTYFAKETPQYLLMKKKSMEAEQTYVWLRGMSKPNSEISADFEKIKQNVEEEGMRSISYRKLLTAKANYRSLMIVSVLCMLMMATGGTPVLAYISILFTSDEVLTPYQFVILFGFIRLLVSFCLPFYIERLQRRTLIVGCFFLISLVHASTAGLYYIHVYLAPIQHFSWYIFFTITLYASIFTILFPLTVMVRGELFPQSMKAIGGFITMSLVSMVAFLTTSLFLVIEDLYGVQTNFLFFAIMSFVGFVYTYIDLPETRGKMLVDIQRELEK